MIQFIYRGIAAATAAKHPPHAGPHGPVASQSHWHHQGDRKYPMGKWEHHRKTIGK